MIDNEFSKIEEKINKAAEKEKKTMLDGFDAVYKKIADNLDGDKKQTDKANEKVFDFNTANNGTLAFGRGKSVAVIAAVVAVIVVAVSIVILAISGVGNTIGGVKKIDESKLSFSSVTEKEFYDNFSPKTTGSGFVDFSEYNVTEYGLFTYNKNPVKAGKVNIKSDKMNASISFYDVAYVKLDASSIVDFDTEYTLGYAAISYSLISSENSNYSYAAFVEFDNFSYRIEYSSETDDFKLFLDRLFG